MPGKAFLVHISKPLFSAPGSLQLCRLYSSLCICIDTDLAASYVTVYGGVRVMQCLYDSQFGSAGGAFLKQHNFTLVVRPALLAQLVSSVPTNINRCVKSSKHVLSDSGVCGLRCIVGV